VKRAHLVLLVTSTLSACRVPATDARFTGSLPDQASFPEVTQVLVRHCGTLDCHGSSGRNLRLYGSEGLRLSPDDRPQTPTCTSDDEVAQDYASVVGLEPEVLSAVVADGGAHPERLTIVRKARGAEDHKGGAPFQQGDAGDRCLTSWLADNLDMDACLGALPPSAAGCFDAP
jgi:hypothetical protein